MSLVILTHHVSIRRDSDPAIFTTTDTFADRVTHRVIRVIRGRVIRNRMFFAEYTIEWLMWVIRVIRVIALWGSMRVIRVIRVIRVVMGLGDAV